MTSEIVRHSFGQPCFECGDPVATPRIRTLREHAEQRGRKFLLSDVLCVECKRRADALNVDVTRPMRR